MVKSDSHMERIRQRLLDEGAGIKKGEEKRREREGKKFGKQVQIEKIKEREKGKKDMEERLQGLKRSTYSFQIYDIAHMNSTVVFSLILREKRGAGQCTSRRRGRL